MASGQCYVHVRKLVLADCQSIEGAHPRSRPNRHLTGFTNGPLTDLARFLKLDHWSVRCLRHQSYNSQSHFVLTTSYLKLVRLFFVFFFVFFFFADRILMDKKHHLSTFFSKNGMGNASLCLQAVPSGVFFFSNKCAKTTERRRCHRSLRVGSED